MLETALTLFRPAATEPSLLEINLSIMVFMPLAAGLLAAVLPARLARFPVPLAALGVLAYAAIMVIDYQPGLRELQYDTYAQWIPQLGISYALGLDGLNLFLIALTALLWAPIAVWSAVRVPDRPRTFFLHLGLAETAVLGAFCAQDLILFVLFFDLMLVPFYFLIGGWGSGERVRATTKFVIYTLVGSLFMLAGAVALGVLAAGPDQAVSFSLAELERRGGLGVGAQAWIFAAFALAFIVKMPLFPVHGWMPDAYRATPIPVLVLLSAVLSKVGAYGFLRIVLPLLPEGTALFQEAMIVLAVVSILYGSVVAFTADDVRLVVGYSSVAQLGFITLGIFSLDPLGAQGAVMQMVNHGLVVAPLFLLVAAIAARAGGVESLGRLGGMATRAPVLATLFVITAFATLAMPGSPNFVGELLILFGIFAEHFVYGLVAAVGVVLAAVYMIRAFQKAMHGPARPGAVESGDLGGLELAVVAPLVAVIVALGVYPQLVLGRTEGATVSRIDAAAHAAGQAPRAAAGLPSYCR